MKKLFFGFVLVLNNCTSIGMHNMPPNSQPTFTVPTINDIYYESIYRELKKITYKDLADFIRNKKKSIQLPKEKVKNIINLTWEFIKELKKNQPNSSLLEEKQTEIMNILNAIQQ